MQHLLTPEEGLFEVIWPFLLCIAFVVLMLSTPVLLVSRRRLKALPQVFSLTSYSLFFAVDQIATMSMRMSVWQRGLSI